MISVFGIKNMKQILYKLKSTPGPEILIRYVRNRSFECFHESERILKSIKNTTEWKKKKKEWLNCYQELLSPFIKDCPPLKPRIINTTKKDLYRIENVVFQSFQGWGVNASIYIPSGKGPFPAVICPCGHSPKWELDYQVCATTLVLNGYIAVTFDAPVFGEKNYLNDHFQNGVACYLTGIWSKVFFVADALRCIDYLATREDADIKNGVGMTGVSGGGHTTITCAAIDERISCIAPTCCFGNLQNISVEDLYTQCPETIGPGLLGKGIDLLQEMALSAPKPCLMNVGEKDEVYKVEYAREFFSNLHRIYRISGFSSHLKLFVQENVGHGYYKEMAEETVKWMNTHLKKRTSEVISLDSIDTFVLDAKFLKCHPEKTVNMFSINKSMAEKLAKETVIPQNRYELSKLVRKVLSVEKENYVPRTVYALDKKKVWWHCLEEVVLERNPEIFIPGLCLRNSLSKSQLPVFLFIDERGKWEELKQNRFLSRAAGFLNRSKDSCSDFLVCSIDVSGYGETSPDPSHYDLAGWCNTIRILSYLCIGLGEPLLGIRVKDALTWLSYLKSLPVVDKNRIFVGGYGAGALVALHVAILDQSVKGLLCSNMLASFKHLCTNFPYSWNEDVFVPNILKYYDLPEIIPHFSIPVAIINPLDELRKVLSESEMEQVFSSAIKKKNLTFKTKLKNKEAEEIQLNWLKSLLIEKENNARNV